jgi:hypothetical protein
VATCAASVIMQAFVVAMSRALLSHLNKTMRSS